MPMLPLLTTPCVLNTLLEQQVGLQLVDVRYSLGAGAAENAKTRFNGAHVPGSVWLDLADFSDATSPYPFMFPGTEAFKERWQQAGLSLTMPTVFIHDEELPTAFRWWWMAQLAALPKLSVLDGGLQAWQQADLPIITTIATASESVISPSQHRTPSSTLTSEHTASSLVGVVSKAEVQTALSQCFSTEAYTTAMLQILDARSPERFAGTAPEPRAGCRAGHIEGSFNLPYNQFFNEGGSTLKAPSQLQKALTHEGFNWQQGVISTCGSGVTACVLAFVLQYLGYPHPVSVYDGSWAEWGSEWVNI